MVRQLESLGTSFSTSGGSSGLRLLMGSEVLELLASVVKDPTTLINQTLTDVFIPTKYLFPASLEAFDPRCNTNDVDEAYANNCSLVGTWNGNHSQPAWDELPDYILGYSKSAWYLAGGPEWRALRGMTQAYLKKRPPGASGLVDDIFVLMESPPSTTAAAPFSGLRDKPFWIINQTAYVSFGDILVDELPTQAFVKPEG